MYAWLCLDLSSAIVILLFQLNGVLGGNLLFDLIYRLSDGQVQEDTFSSSSSPACNPKMLMWDPAMLAA